MQRYIAFTLLLFLIYTEAIAQENPVRFRVISADSLKSIPYSSITVINKGKSAITDDVGFVMLNVSAGDSLIVRALGYKPFVFSINTLAMPPVYRILLLPQPYLIDDVVIRGIKNRDELKKAILRMKLPSSEPILLPGVKQYTGPMTPIAPTILNPISLLSQTEWAKKNRVKNWNKNRELPKMK